MTNQPGHDAHCAWSPDGEWLAFTSARGGFKDEAALHPGNAQQYGDIYVMRPDGSHVRQLTDTPLRRAPLRGRLCIDKRVCRNFRVWESRHVDRERHRVLIFFVC